MADSKTSRLGQRPSWRWLRLVLQLGSVLLFGLLLLWGGPQAWAQLLAGRPRHVLASLLLFGLATGVSALRLQTMAQAITSERIAGWSRFYHLTMTARALGLVVPRSISTIGGKSVGLRAMGVPLTQSAWIVIMDNVLDLYLLGLLAIPGLFLLQDLSAWSLFLAPVLLGVASLLLYGITASQHLRTLVRGIVGLPLVSRLLRIQDEQEAFMLPPPKTALQTLGLTLFLNSLLALGYYFTGQAVGLTHSWLIFLAAFPVVQLSLVLSVTPGGLGIFDAGWYGVLLLAEVPRQEALTFVIAQRAYIFVFVLLWTGVSVLISLLAARLSHD